MDVNAPAVDETDGHFREIFVTQESTVAQHDASDGLSGNTSRQQISSDALEMYYDQVVISSNRPLD